MPHAASNTVLIWRASLAKQPTASRVGRVSLAQIRYFVAVAEEGNVGRASTGLRVAQPAVSRQIRQLEDELGTSLFERTSRGMKLSAAGEVFLGHARGILDGVRAAEKAVKGVG